ncbi:MAG: hypothetical protein U0176_03225 [Bacteroidia bacterium]
MEGLLGMIKMAVTTKDAGDWLICDGRLLNASEYPVPLPIEGTDSRGRVRNLPCPTCEIHRHSTS